jgi:RNase P subunit RPR2
MKVSIERRRFCRVCRKEIKPGDSWERHSIGKSRVLYCSSCADKVNRELAESYKMSDIRYP